MLEGRCSQSTIDLIAPHCDVIERLQDVPPSANVRGYYFQSMLNVLERLDKLSLFASYVPPVPRSSVKFYPLSHYLFELAVAGACVAEPAQLHDGIREITRQNATAFKSSLLGRVLMPVLRSDPVRLTEQGAAARRQTTTYGHWQIKRHGPRELEVVYHTEYMWIESAVAGAAAGAFEACGVQAHLTTSVESRYEGSTHITW